MILTLYKIEMPLLGIDRDEHFPGLAFFNNAPIKGCDMTPLA